MIINNQLMNIAIETFSTLQLSKNIYLEIHSLYCPIQRTLHKYLSLR